MAEDTAPSVEEDAGGVIEPWENPIKLKPGEPTVGRPVSEILAEANASSERTARDGGWTGAKLRYRWVDGETYNIVVAKNAVTTLKLFPGEGYVNYAYGYEHFGPEILPTWSGTRDQKAMAYGPAQTSIPITPWVSGRCTDLTIYTTWRDIFINICATGTRKAYNKSVEWWMPGEELRRFTAALRSGEIAVPTVEPATGVPHAEVNARYAVDGAVSEGWATKEWLAFNDSRKTYVVPPSGLPFNPVPAVRTAGGGDTPLFRSLPRRDVEGSYYQIDALPPEIMMVHGDETLTLRRLP